MNHCTYENMKDNVGAPPMDRRDFRDHLKVCTQGCRLTQYTGRLVSQWSPRHPSDTGHLCETGFELWVAPEKMREVVNPKNADVNVETLMRWMGHERC